MMKTDAEKNMRRCADHPRFQVITRERPPIRRGSSVRARRYVGERVYIWRAPAVGVGLIAKRSDSTIEDKHRPDAVAGDELRRRMPRARAVRLFLPVKAKCMARTRAAVERRDDDMVFVARDGPRWVYGMAKAID